LKGEFLFALTIPFTMLFAPALIAPVCAKAIVAGVVAVGAAYAGKFVSDTVGWSWRPSEADCYDYLSGSFGVTNSFGNKALHTKKHYEKNPSGSAENLEKNPDWKRSSHPDQEKNGSQEFTNIKTGEKIRFDKGTPGKPGHGANDHYHRLRPRPESPGEYDYLNKDGEVVPKGHKQSHLYLPENTGRG